MRQELGLRVRANGLASENTGRIRLYPALEEKQQDICNITGYFNILNAWDQREKESAYEHQKEDK